MRNIGLGFSPNDKFLLLSTGRQHSQQSATAACGAGGRLLVGYGDHEDKTSDNPGDQASRQSNVNSFQKELKQLQATDWDPSKAAKGRSQENRPTPFPEDGGGAVGLNAALSAGLQLLSRYRLANRSTENFGMGRLPSSALLNPSGGGAAMHALQPACLVLITDGVCLRSSSTDGGGSLQLQYGNMPLREFYKEPFRWDQRIFCLGVGAKDGVQSSQFLHPHLRTLCEVTGGSHLILRSSVSLSQVTGHLLNQIAPPRPRDLPIPDPIQNLDRSNRSLVGGNGTFVSGGPVCCFQALEPEMDGQAPPRYRAMLLYVPHKPAYTQNNPAPKEQVEFQSPIWCIPESFFPSKKLDTLPPRPAQPILLFSRYPGRLGSKCFEAASLMKALARLDQLILSSRKMQGQQQPKLLSRDVYICDWISPDQKATWGPQNPDGMEYFPVLVIGAGRPALNDGEANYFSIGILHTPPRTSSLGSSLGSATRVSTLTLLPPEPHILLPLLLRAAELEHRALKKIQASAEKDGAYPSANITQKLIAASRNVHLDDHWRNEFRAYLFRLPPYYQNALKRSLRGILPTSVAALVAADGAEGSLAFQCFSKNCAQKIRFAEQQAHERIERQENQEARLRSRGNFVALPIPQQQQQQLQQHGGKRGADAAQPTSTAVGYGQFDARFSTDSFLAALKNMPAPWRMGVGTKKTKGTAAPLSKSSPAKVGKRKRTSAVVSLGDLPANCLMAYYESRRRWIFGGSGLSTRGLFIDGVPNDGCNSQQCGAEKDIFEVPLLSMAGVGVSQLNSTTVSKMGDYRERLLWSRAPVVGYGSNDSAGVSATTAVNGAPVWSVDDDAMPVAFFDSKTGEFADSVQARVNSRLYVNFGNPYKDKRADSLVPLKFLSQSPSMQKARNDEDQSGAMTPPGSPPHDSFSSIEGEGEAAFAGKPISRKSLVRKSPTRSDDGIDEAPVKRRKVEAPPSPVKANHEDTSGTHSKTAHPLPQPNRVKSEHAKQPPPARRPSLPESAPRRPSLPTLPPRKSSVPAPPSQPGKPTAKKPLPPPPRPPPPKPPPSKKHPGPNSRPPPPKSSPSPSPSTTKPPPPIRPNSVPPKFPSIQQQGRPNPGQPPQGQKEASPPPKPAIDYQSPEQKPNVNLPPGWMCVWSKSQKRWYFFDTKTNKSVWQWPPP
ncbi:unnamed protein product [Cylindrotheca closterium]|uniref:WW domain-containing protein n=1 Tax=Cylindrotheca closterium TaxID=2856 RepID=A0AAD2FC89_9STRA|nr:unnamed protein product [Cylindrotheca closterium]